MGATTRTRNGFQQHHTFEMVKQDIRLISSHKTTCVKDRMFTQIDAKKVEEDVKKLTARRTVTLKKPEESLKGNLHKFILFRHGYFNHHKLKYIDCVQQSVEEFF